MQEVPEEECTLVPQKRCHNEFTIVPSLVQKETCMDVPKEVCTTARVNPRKTKKPVFKRWCGPVPENEPQCPLVCANLQDEEMAAACK